MSSQNIQLILTIWHGLIVQGRFQQALGRRVGIAAIGSCRVGIILDRQAKVARSIPFSKITNSGKA
jgi:hypothetical protein